MKWVPSENNHSIAAGVRYRLWEVTDLLALLQASGAGLRKSAGPAAVQFFYARGDEAHSRP
jgi:hypothetical protein